MKNKSIMSETSSNNTAKIIGATLIGVAVGGLLGVLFAPDKGSATRSKIFKKGQDLTHSMKEKFNSLKDDLHKESAQAVEKGKEEGKNFSSSSADDRQRTTKTL
jgi:gas vesicle protein